MSGNQLAISNFSNEMVGDLKQIFVRGSPPRYPHPAAWRIDELKKEEKSYGHGENDTELSCCNLYRLRQFWGPALFV